MLRININGIKSNEPVCYVVGAMEHGEKSFEPEESDLVIAADGGYMNLIRLGIKPDFLVGDFDSLGVIPEGENIIRLPKEKNDTDTLYAVRLGLEKGYSLFALYGCIGGRLDHTLANLQLLSYIVNQKARGFLIGTDTIITSIKDDIISFPKGKKGIISVFCGSEKAEGVYLTGLKYPLENATLTNDMPLGISNEFTENEAGVAVKRGILTVMWFE